jgi:hypothetical protein
MSWEDCPKCGTEAEIVTDNRGLTVGRACPECECAWAAPRFSVNS